MATSPSSSPIPLNYLVVLDLEAYCDDPNDPHRPEIVEFPWLVYDLSTFTVLDHKQIYITPRWNSNPNPTPHAVRRNNLGVDVAFAPSLADALLQFDAYIYQSFVVSNKSFYLLTDGHWDLSYYLFFEAARKAVVLAPHFRAYFNLRSEFCKCYPHAPSPTDRTAMFSFLDLLPPTRASGVDECIGLATIVTRLLRDGHRFLHPEVISDYDWASVPSRLPTVATPIATATPVGAVIRLRGLPWTSSEHEVDKFLTGIAIVPGGIHFVRNAQGKATGEAFVQLESADGVATALSRHKQTVGRRYIEVFKSSPVDMANYLGRADARRHMYAGAHVATVKGRGATAGAGNGNGAGNSGSNGRGRANRNAKDSSANGGSNSGNGAMSRFVVRVTGLGDSATADDVSLLMEGVQIVGEGVHIIVGSDGKCNGEAFVEVVSEGHVRKAISRSGTDLPIGRADSGACRYVTVEVRKSSLGQLRSVVYGSEGGGKGERGGGFKRGGNGSGHAKGSSAGAGGRFSVVVRNVGEWVGVEDIVELLEDVRIEDCDVGFVGGMDGGERMARVELKCKEDRETALTCGGRAAAGRGAWSEADVVIETTGTGDGGESSAAGAMGGAGGGGTETNAGGSGSGSGGGSPGGSTTAVGTTTTGSSRVVRMRGLPYTSDDKDIVEFFDGFRIADGGIWRGKDRHGRASGEASVTFVHEEDAREAVGKLDKAHMGNRYIELKF